jgi:glucan phosphorylase
VDLTKNKESIHSAKIAYFSMEVGLDPALPTYSGGLGLVVIYFDIPMVWGGGLAE